MSVQNCIGLLEGGERLPEPDQVDAAHCEWRIRVIEAADAEGLDFTHGVAAKMINIYLKASNVCGAITIMTGVRALHPPIDAVLLAELSEQDVGGLRRRVETGHEDQVVKPRLRPIRADHQEPALLTLPFSADKFFAAIRQCYVDRPPTDG